MSDPRSARHGIGYGSMPISAIKKKSRSIGINVSYKRLWWEEPLFSRGQKKWETLWVEMNEAGVGDIDKKTMLSHTVEMFAMVTRSASFVGLRGNHKTCSKFCEKAGSTPVSQNMQHFCVRFGVVKAPAFKKLASSFCFCLQFLSTVSISLISPKNMFVCLRGSTVYCITESRTATECAHMRTSVQLGAVYVVCILHTAYCIPFSCCGM